MSITYLFVDGGHLRKAYNDAVREWFDGDGEIDFEELKGQEGAYKLFYYDCLDDHRRYGESEEDHKARVESQENWFNRIAAVKGAHVHQGLLVRSGKKRQQKEVDILLAVDVLNHAVRHNMTNAVLLTGDSDFKPLVETLVQMGLFVRVVGDAKATAPRLVRAADDSKLLSFRDYFGFSSRTLRAKYPLPEETQTAYRKGDYQGRLIHVGTLGDTTIEVSFYSEHFKAYVPISNERDAYVVSHANFERLKLYLKIRFGEVTWRP